MPVRHDLFNHVTGLLRYGQAQEELSEAMCDCVQRSQETGKASTLTLIIKIQPKATPGNTG